MCPTSGRSIRHGLWNQITGSNEVGRLQETFGVLDTDGDGQIKSSDLTQFFQSCVGTPISEEEVQLMIRMADLDGNGAVDLHEFERLMTEDVADKEGVMEDGQAEVLREMFRILDVNQDGVLCAEDLAAAMDLFGQPICEEEELHAMVTAAATSTGTIKSPTIDFDSFCRFMTRSSHP